MSVTLVQKASSTDPAVNRAALVVVDEVADQQRPDLVVLPEAYARDFGPAGSDVAPYAEELDGPFVTRLSGLAARHGFTLVAGMFQRSEDPERPYNTLVVVGPEGLRATYRKIHLYDSFGYRESDRLSPGPLEPVVVDVAGVRVGLMTCYDLRFPEMARALVDRGAELLVVPSAWVAGERKVAHWRTLLAARAIENTVYVAAAGQPGPRYTGHSALVAPTGDVVAELGEDEGVLTAAVERTLLEEVRRANPSLANRRL
ncbi:carbon-nitrogen hydrolase family protein [Nocardioides mesophilus]|uniref:Carbon-nitrogen hydrolase family protein n=1 Tax=Nocardioides mesophilus TaxID=433659 RepID=A0A7G9RH79_9ACTN|nr:carbon-nitrogen hydrolase family protein [Nocardioides mesophilus]QNN54954.1 carbon-nitrogen hydrolase family protein [Nocardioides mesophilus]